MVSTREAANLSVGVAAQNGIVARRRVSEEKDRRRLAAAVSLAILVDALSLLAAGSFLAERVATARSTDEALWISVRLEDGGHAETELGTGTEHAAHERAARERTAPLPAHRKAAESHYAESAGIPLSTKKTPVQVTDAAIGGTELGLGLPPGALNENISPIDATGTELNGAELNGATGTEQKGAKLESTNPWTTREDFLLMLDEAISSKLIYPKRARDRGIEGRVLLEIGVDMGGGLRTCAVETSSGSSLLDGAARNLIEAIFPLEARLAEPFTALVAVEYRLR